MSQEKQHETVVPFIGALSTALLKGLFHLEKK